MTFPWAWTTAVLAAGLIGSGLWLKTLEQEAASVAWMVANSVTPDIAPAHFQPDVPEPSDLPPPQSNTAEEIPGALPAAGSTAGYWFHTTVPGLQPEASKQAVHDIARTLTSATFFGAIASPRTHITSYYVTKGYGELAQAEKHALEICQNIESDCVVFAWLVPSGWDGAYEGTFNAGQNVLWDDFASQISDRYLAFAASLEGAASLGEGTDPDQAVFAALAACDKQQDRMRQPAVSMSDCTIRATKPAHR